MTPFHTFLVKVLTLSTLDPLTCHFCQALPLLPSVAPRVDALDQMWVFFFFKSAKFHQDNLWPPVNVEFCSIFIFSSSVWGGDSCHRLSECIHTTGETHTHTHVLVCINSDWFLIKLLNASHLRHKNVVLNHLLINKKLFNVFLQYLLEIRACLHKYLVFYSSVRHFPCPLATSLLLCPWCFGHTLRKRSWVIWEELREPEVISSFQTIG